MSQLLGSEAAWLGGTGRGVLAVQASPQHLSHALTKPNSTVSLLLGWASSTAHGPAAAPRESEQPELCTVSLTPCHSHRAPHTMHLTPYPAHRDPHSVSLTPCPSHHAPHTVPLTLCHSHHAPHTVPLTPCPSHHVPHTVPLTLCHSHRGPHTVSLIPCPSHRAPHTVPLTPCPSLRAPHTMSLTLCPSCHVPHTVSCTPCPAHLPPTACTGSTPACGWEHTERNNAHSPFFRNLSAVKKSVNPVLCCVQVGETTPRKSFCNT